MDPQSELISNTLALNVALKTMKERCLSLQQRLIQVEKENVILKTNGNFMDVSEYKTKQGSVSEIAFLRAQNQELLNQKSILSENIKLISKENSQLWTRLSQLTRADQIIPGQEDLENGKINPHTQIVRSKTFTIQHNPKLKERNSTDVELEDISLESFENERPIEIDSNKMFGFLHDSLNDDGNDVEHMKKVSEGLICIKKELLKQQSDLKVALTNWRKFKNCQACKDRAKIVKVDEKVQTDVELTIELEMETIEPNSIVNSDKNDANVVDLTEAKLRASQMIKICPMCGELFEKSVTFEKFQEHVESHFLLEEHEEHDRTLDFEVVGLGNF